MTFRLSSIAWERSTSRLSFCSASTVAEQQDLEVVARGNITLNFIATYRAIGGGWEMRLTRDVEEMHGKHKHKHMAAGEPIPLPEADVHVLSMPEPKSETVPTRKVMFKVAPAPAPEELPTPTIATSTPVPVRGFRLARSGTRRRPLRNWSSRP